MSLALFFAQHVSNASIFIFRSLRLCVGILLWFDVCWRYGVVRLEWCGILMQTEALPTHSHKLLKMNILAFETCWAKNKASNVSCSIFIQIFVHLLVTVQNRNVYFNSRWRKETVLQNTQSGCPSHTIIFQHSPRAHSPESKWSVARITPPISDEASRHHRNIAIHLTSYKVSHPRGR